MKSVLRRTKAALTALLVMGICVWAATCSHADALWQWSVPAPSIPDRRALLWIPPNCAHVRGVVVACQNMLEQPLFERPAFRAAAAQNGLGLLLIVSGHDKGMDDDKTPDHPKRSALDIFLNPNYPNGDEDPQGAGQDLQKVLDALADESGYSELRYAPLMPVGHSSAGSFVWHLYRWDPSRIFAMMPIKTGAKDDGPSDIPVLMIESEWFDYGSNSNNVWSRGSVQGRNGGKCLFGYYVDLGSGHQNVSDDSMAMIRLWLNKVVAARIPAHAPLNGPVALNPVAADSGWLIDSTKIGQPGTQPVAYTDYQGDKSKAYWYLDKELADYVQNHMATQLAKKPQQINFFTPDTSPATSGGTYSFSPQFLDDRGTFKVQATYLDALTTKTDLFPPDTKLGSSGMPILYRVNSGALVQVGPDTFRIRPHAGPIPPQGNPWEPTLVAYTLGNGEYRPTERPAHVNVSIINTAGQAQTITFPAIPNQKLGVKSVKLAATASSGLPVDYFVVSGPAELGPEGQSLVFKPMPPRSKYPVRVLVSAFQWGRPVEPKIQSAGPVMQEFFLTKK